MPPAHTIEFGPKQLAETKIDNTPLHILGVDDMRGRQHGRNTMLNCELSHQLRQISVATRSKVFGCPRAITVCPRELCNGAAKSSFRRHLREVGVQDNL